MSASTPSSTPVPPPPMLSTVKGDVLKIEGALNLASMRRLVFETAAYAGQKQLPDFLTIDFSNVAEIDSSGVALLLHWRRESIRMGKALRYINLPKNLTALAELYGVEELIHCPSQRSASAAC